MDDLKNVFDKIEKAESILKELERKREIEFPEKNVVHKLSKEQQNAIDSARHALASIKDKLNKELAVHTLELDKSQEDLALLQTRLKVGEISEAEFQDRSKHVIDRIKSLEKKVVEIQSLINTKFAEDVVSTAEPGQIVPAAPSAQSISEESKQPQEAGAKTVIQREASSPVIRATNPETDVIRTAPATGNSTPEQETETAPATNPQAAEEITGPTMKKGDNEPSSEEKIKAGPGEPVTLKPHKPSFHLHPLSEPPVKKDTHRKPTMLSKNRALWIMILAVIAGLLLVSGILFFIPRTGSNIGNKAPDFAMQLSSENMSSLSTFRGASVILVFWDRDFWDDQFFYVNGVARKLYTPDKLNQIYDQTPHNELAIIAIASGTTNSEVDRLIKDYEIKFPVIVDSFGKLRASYNVTEEPTYIFIDKGGVIRARVEGPLIDMSSLEQIIYSVSKNDPIKPVKPPISDVIIQSITEKSAIINWTTSIPTTTQVDIDGKNIQTVITTAPTTLHSLSLRDLEPATSYHIRIIYNINNINVSEHSFSALTETVVSKRYILTTSSQDTTYPEISGISTGFITDSSITVSWKTDEPATGDIDYGTSREYKDTASQGSNLSIWHTVKIEGLKPDTLYYLKLRSRDASGKETAQELEAVKTLSAIEIAPVLGKRAPDFTLYALDGTKFTLSQFLGKRILLNFWLEGCPPCEMEMPLIQKAFDKYNRDELIILAINVRGDVDQVNYYIGTQKFTFPVLLDTNGDVDSIYRAPYFPTSYFIDSTGIIRRIATERFQSISEIDEILSKLD